jgi:ubiquinone/menaquinone biosynthesis C-methylase UbiE
MFLVLALSALSAASAQQTQQGQAAKEILDAAGVKGGLIVHAGCGDGKLTAALRAGDSYLVHGLDTDAKHVDKARTHIHSLGLYGKVSVDRFDGEQLPYIDNLVNLLVADDLGKVPMAEVMRVLAPKSVAYIRRDGKWEKTIKPWPEEIDEWTHYLHDPQGTMVGRDRIHHR